MDTVTSDNKPSTSSTPEVKAAPTSGVNDVSIKPPHKQSWLWVVIAMVLLALLGLLAYLIIDNQSLRQNLAETPALQPTIIPVVQPSTISDPTATWQTYTNDKYAFQLKYSKNWFAENCGRTDLLILDPNVKPICETEPYNPILINTLDNYSSIEDYSQTVWQKDSSFSVTKNDQVLIPNEAQLFDIKKIEPAPGPESFNLIVMPIKNGLLLITIDDPQYLSQAIQILSTFILTD